MKRFVAFLIINFLCGIPFANAQNPALVPAIGAIKMGDYAQAIDTLQPIAAKGDTEAQFLLARAYEEAPGNLRNLQSAHSWYLRAAGDGQLGRLI